MFFIIRKLFAFMPVRRMMLSIWRVMFPTRPLVSLPSFRRMRIMLIRGRIYRRPPRRVPSPNTLPVFLGAVQAPISHHLDLIEILLGGLVAVPPPGLDLFIRQQLIRVFDLMIGILLDFSVVKVEFLLPFVVRRLRGWHHVEVELPLFLCRWRSLLLGRGRGYGGHRDGLEDLTGQFAVEDVVRVKDVVLVHV